MCTATRVRNGAQLIGSAGIVGTAIDYKEKKQLVSIGDRSLQRIDKSKQMKKKKRDIPPFD
jgi:hypothetical protein